MNQIENDQITIYSVVKDSFGKPIEKTINISEKDEYLDCKFWKTSKGEALNPCRYYFLDDEKINLPSLIFALADYNLNELSDYNIWKKDLIYFGYKPDEFECLKPLIDKIKQGYEKKELGNHLTIDEFFNWIKKPENESIFKNIDKLCKQIEDQRKTPVFKKNGKLDENNFYIINLILCNQKFSPLYNPNFSLWLTYEDAKSLLFPDQKIELKILKNAVSQRRMKGFCPLEKEYPCYFYAADLIEFLALENYLSEWLIKKLSELKFQVTIYSAVSYTWINCEHRQELTRYISEKDEYLNCKFWHKSKGEACLFGIYYKLIIKSPRDFFIKAICLLFNTTNIELVKKACITYFYQDANSNKNIEDTDDIKHLKLIISELKIFHKEFKDKDFTTDELLNWAENKKIISKKHIKSSRENIRKARNQAIFIDNSKLNENNIKCITPLLRDVSFYLTYNDAKALFFPEINNIELEHLRESVFDDKDKHAYYFNCFTLIKWLIKENHLPDWLLKEFSMLRNLDNNFLFLNKIIYSERNYVDDQPKIFKYEELKKRWELQGEDTINQYVKKGELGAYLKIKDNSENLRTYSDADSSLNDRTNSTYLKRYKDLERLYIDLDHLVIGPESKKFTFSHLLHKSIDASLSGTALRGRGQAFHYFQPTVFEDKLGIKRTLIHFNEKDEIELTGKDKIEITDVVFLEEEIEKIEASKNQKIQDIEPKNTFIESKTPKLIKNGDTWNIEYQGENLNYPSLKGFTYIKYLIDKPNKDIHVNELSFLNSNENNISKKYTKEYLTPLSFKERNQKILDDKAIESIEKEIKKLRESIQEAEELIDIDKAEELKDKLDPLLKEYKKCKDKIGNSRNFRSPSEKNRIAVKNALSSALKDIEKYQPELYEHFKKSLKTGNYCKYEVCLIP